MTIHWCAASSHPYTSTAGGYPSARLLKEFCPQWMMRTTVRANLHGVFKAIASQRSMKKRRVGIVNEPNQARGESSEIDKVTLDCVDQLQKRVPSGEQGSSGSVVVEEDANAGVQLGIASRNSILQACIGTSALLIAIGVLLRQGFHGASMQGWHVLDPTEVSFEFQLWHVQLIILLVISISSSRFILLKIWPDFAESSETANRQILTSLMLMDYVIVAVLPGVSEELLFRGMLLPLIGLNWVGALIAGSIFGCLHLGSGRKYSYVVWATFVGFAYGLATVASGSILVPMVSHSINNLVGGIIWRYTSGRLARTHD